MRAHTHTRRQQPGHADDWLMTYADTITLLLCFFAIFLTVSIAKQDAPKPVAITPVVALPVHPKDFLEGNLPFHGLERADEPTGDPVPAKVEPPPTAKPVVAIEAKPAPQAAAPPKPPAPEPKGDRITMLEIGSAAFFDSGSASLSAAGEAILRDVAVKLKSSAYDDYEITVEGHTDDSPIHTAQFPSNWELSTARAAAVVHFLLDQGIPARRLRAAGYADTFPKLPNRDADGNPIPANQTQNRRVVIKLEKIDRAKPA